MHIELGLLQGNIKGSRKVKLLEFLMFKVLMNVEWRSWYWRFHDIGVLRGGPGFA